MTVAFVFQGGASLSAVQVGMVRALTEAGIRPDLVVGSSAGALNAVAYAQDPTLHGIDAMEHLWTGARRSDVFPLRLGSILAGVTGHGSGLVTPHRLLALIEHALHIHELDETAIPAHVIAADAATGAPVVLSDGPAATALLASASIPGILPPVAWRGSMLVDGSVSADIPILQAEQLGATVSYVLPSVPMGAGLEQRAHGALPILARTLTMVFDRATQRDLATARGQVHTLPAPEPRGLCPLNFRHSAELIRLGYDNARAWLDDKSTAPAVA
jgi:NTE family protein